MLSVLLASLLSVSHGDVLDSKLIYQNPLAYVRSPESGVFLKSSTYRGVKIKYLDAEIGRSIPLVKWQIGNDFQDCEFQLGLEAATWAVLGYYKGAFPLITQDFLLAVPLMFRFNSFSGAVKFNHISSHRGDGFDLLWNKLLSKEEKEKIELAERKENISISPPVKSYSRDFVSLDLAHGGAWKYGRLKLYVQVTYAHKMIPKRLKRWSTATGIEIKHPSGLFFADDIRFNQDTDSVDFSGQLGWLFEGRSAQSRICLTYYNGSDRRGQFLGNRLKEFGIGFFLR